MMFIYYLRNAITTKLLSSWLISGRPPNPASIKSHCCSHPPSSIVLSDALQIMIIQVAEINLSFDLDWGNIWTVEKHKRPVSKVRPNCCVITIITCNGWLLRQASLKAVEPSRKLISTCRYKELSVTPSRQSQRRFGDTSEAVVTFSLPRSLTGLHYIPRSLKIICWL